MGYWTYLMFLIGDVDVVVCVFSVEVSSYIWNVTVTISLKR